MPRADFPVAQWGKGQTVSWLISVVPSADLLSCWTEGIQHSLTGKLALLGEYERLRGGGVVTPNNSKRMRAGRALHWDGAQKMLAGCQIKTSASLVCLLISHICSYLFNMAEIQQFELIQYERKTHDEFK